MSDFVKLRGAEYPVERFSGVHVMLLAEMLRQDKAGNWSLGTFAQQSEVGELVLEVILPTLPSDVISVSPRGRYIWQLNELEIPYLLLQIMRVWHQRQLAVAKARKDKAATQESEQRIQSIDEHLVRVERFVGNEAPPVEEAYETGEDAETQDRIDELEQELATLAPDSLSGKRVDDLIADLERELATLKNSTNSEPRNNAEALH